jgi:hypothetical protein
MESVIVQYEPPGRRDQQVLRLGPGQEVTFGRGAPGHPVHLQLEHPAVPRLAGRITAAEDHWLLSNLSLDRTYLVENPEGAGEHVKVAPRRLAAPIPFELARVVLPVDRDQAEFVVFAPSTASPTAPRCRRWTARPPWPRSRWTRRPSTS